MVLYNLYIGLTIMERFKEFFTNWTLLLQIASIILTMFAARSPELFGKHSGSVCLKMTHHILYSICIFSNFVVVSVYWTALHGFILKRFADRPDRIMHMYLIHIFPAVVGYANSYVTQTVLKREFWKILLVFSLTYLAVLMVYGWVLGKTLYPFLKFGTEVVEPTLISFAIIVGMMLAYLGMVKVDESVKGKHTKVSDEHQD